MGSIIGNRIDYNGVGALRGQRHIPCNPRPGIFIPFSRLPPFNEAKHLRVRSSQHVRCTGTWHLWRHKDELCFRKFFLGVKRLFILLAYGARRIIYACPCFRGVATICKQIRKRAQKIGRNTTSCMNHNVVGEQYIGRDCWKETAPAIPWVYRFFLACDEELSPGVGRRPTCLRPKPETAHEKSLAPRVLRLVLSDVLYLPHKIERLLNLNFGYRCNSYRMRSITLPLRAMSIVGFFLRFVSMLFEVLKYFIHGLACSGF